MSEWLTIFEESWQHVCLSDDLSREEGGELSPLAKGGQSDLALSKKFKQLYREVMRYTELYEWLL